MALKRFGNEKDPYLRRSYIRVSAEDLEPTSSKTPFDYQVKLEETIEDVVSIELAGYDFSTRLAPTFTGNNPVYRPFLDDEGIRTFNIRVYHSNGTDFVDLEVDMQSTTPGLDYSDLTTDNTIWRSAGGDGAVANVIKQALVDQGNAFVNSTNTTAYIRIGDTNQMDIMFVRTGPTPVNSVISFPPGSNAAAVLGFPDDTLSYNSASNTDYSSIGTGTNQVIHAPLAINEQVTRFIDVHLREVPELQPLARVFTVRPSEFTAQYEIGRMPRPQRILTNSLRKLETLTIRLTTGDEQRVLSLKSPLFNSFVFEVVSLGVVARGGLPTWIKNKQAFTL